MGIEVSLTIVGAVVGGIAGGVIGIFNGSDCDCGSPQGISIVNSGEVECTMFYQLYAWGAGADAEFFDWIVTEGNSSAFFPSEPALLSTAVTQSSPSTPLVVSVTALCPDDIGNEVAMAENTLPSIIINLFSIPLNEVGDILVFSNYNLSSGISVSVGNSDSFNVSSTAGMSNVTFSMSIVPPYLGSVIQNGDDSFTINWQNAGAGSIIFTGTNVCSGLQNSTSVGVIVGQ